MYPGTQGKQAFVEKYSVRGCNLTQRFGRGSVLIVDCEVVGHVPYKDVANTPLPTPFKYTLNWWEP